LDRAAAAQPKAAPAHEPPIKKSAVEQIIRDMIRYHGFPSKKFMLLKIVGDAASGIPTREVIAKGHGLGATDWETGNVSPQLSEYRKAGFLELENGVLWKISDKGRAYLRDNEKGQP
jgi:hypothetical protein